MEQIESSKEELLKELRRITEDVAEPLYRGLGKEAEKDWQEEGIMKPKCGSMSVGTGVFFTNKPEYATDCAGGVMVVTARNLLDPDRTAVDTRVKGYSEPFRERLAEKGEYDGWAVEAEVQKHDTITRETMDEQMYVYTKREQVGKDKVLAEIRIIQ
ncbi:hypothetical protein KY362_01965 [Candidatus Woesearchaeota archaeon]|nr:hypothetical protein [Candidatus Woesearchaeota archaeon]